MFLHCLENWNCSGTNARKGKGNAMIAFHRELFLTLHLYEKPKPDTFNLMSTFFTNDSLSKLNFGWNTLLLIHPALYFCLLKQKMADRYSMN